MSHRPSAIAHFLVALRKRPSKKEVPFSRNTALFIENNGDFPRNKGLFIENIGDISRNKGLFIENIGDISRNKPLLRREVACFAVAEQQVPRLLHDVCSVRGSLAEHFPSCFFKWRRVVHPPLSCKSTCCFWVKRTIITALACARAYGQKLLLFYCHICHTIPAKGCISICCRVFWRFFCVQFLHFAVTTPMKRHFFLHFGGLSELFAPTR